MVAQVNIENASEAVHLKDREKTNEQPVVCMLADSNSEITMQPQPTEKEIHFILEAIAEYLTVKVCFPATHAALQCITLIPTCSCYVLCPGQRCVFSCVQSFMLT